MQLLRSHSLQGASAGITGRRPLFITAAVVLAASLVVLVSAPSDATRTGLRVVDPLPAEIVAGGGPMRMLVDAEHNLGFAAGPRSGHAGQWLAMYDLETLEPLDTLELDGSFGVVAGDRDGVAQWAVDAKRQRLFARAGGLLPCSLVATVREETGFDFRNLFFVFEYGPGPTGERELRLRREEVPCSGEHVPFTPTSGMYDPATDNLYLTGRHSFDDHRSFGDSATGLADNDGTSMVIRQLDVSKSPPQRDWEVDLRTVGCGRRDSHFVYRLPHEVITYCWDARTGPYSVALGLQGYVVRIPLVEGNDGIDHPQTVDGGPPLTDPLTGTMTNAVIRLTPALPGAVEPFVDPQSGRLLLVTTGSINGNAIWVFEPREERFIGVITGGFAAQRRGNTSVGVDVRSGRVYLLTAGGILVGHVRGSPLAPGLITDVLANTEEAADFVSSSAIGVAPDVSACGGCTRLFVPVRGSLAYTVVEARLDPPAKVPELDPDRFTTQVDEEVGVTGVNTSGAALASGAHVIVAGGPTRTITQADPFCHAPIPSVAPFIEFEESAFGGCAAGLLLTPGHREFALASTDLDVSSASGASATAAGLEFSPNDRATDRDIRQAAECHATNVEGSSDALQRFMESQGGQGDGDDPANDGPADSATTTTTTPKERFFDEIRTGCGAAFAGASSAGLIDDPASGTHGMGDRGYPVRQVHCDDFASDPSRRHDTSGPGGTALPVFASMVSCDASAAAASAASEAPALQLPSVEEPVISVSRVRSSASSSTTSEGRVTKVEAAAEGIRIGPLAIGELRTTAETRSQGRSGTAHAKFDRLWCDVVFQSEALGGCHRPEDDDIRNLVDRFNQMSPRLRISVPTAEVDRTDGGYQAVVTKDWDERAADQAVNDDDSHTVAGLQVLLFSDGSEGRNRYLLQLAGVHSEARYGIFVIPRFAVPTFDSLVEHLGGLDERVTSGRAGQPGRPDEFETLVLGRRASLHRPADEVFFEQVDRSPFGIVRSALAWLLNNPLEAALLFAMWLVLATPIYLAMRRRSYSWAVALEEEFG